MAGGTFTTDAAALAAQAWLEERFGLPAATFAGHRFVSREGSGTIWVVAADCAPPPVPLEALGLLVFRDPPPRGKPANTFILRFGDQATRNVYRLDAEGAVRFMEGAPQPVQPGDDDRGYCVVWGPGRVIGCGRVKEGLLHSTLPKGWRRDTDPHAGW